MLLHTYQVFSSLEGDLHFHVHFFFNFMEYFLVACTRLYKSPCRSVRPSVGPSHFAFFAFLGYLEVGKHIFKYVVSHKQHFRSFCINQSVIKSISWSVSLSVGPSKFACLCIFRLHWGERIQIQVFHGVSKHFYAIQQKGNPPI